MSKKPNFATKRHPASSNDRGESRIALIVTVALTVLTLGANAGHAVSIERAAIFSTYWPITGLVRDNASGCLFYGLSIHDRTDPNYPINSANGGLLDRQLSYFGPGCSGGTGYSTTLGEGRTFSPTVGPDDHIWFVTNGFIGKISRAPSLNPATTLYPRTNVVQIVAGSDGNIWYSAGGRLTKMNTSGQNVAEYNIGYRAESVTVGFINVNTMTVASDGSIWMIGRSVPNETQAIVRITPAGVATAFPLPVVPGTQLIQQAVGIAAGPDGDVWYVANSPSNNRTVSSISAVGKITAAGAFTSWTFTGDAGAIAPGPDGNMWFTAVERTFVPQGDSRMPTATGRAARITPSGQMTEYEVFRFQQSSGDVYYGVVAMPGIGTGPDGKLYITRHDVSTAGNNSRGQFLQRGEAYALTPDAANTDNDPTVTVLTSGEGRGAVRMRISKNANNSQSIVTLTATPSGNSTFSGWSEPSCQGNNPTCQVTLTGDKTVTANFTVPSVARRSSHQGAIFTTSAKTSVIRVIGKPNGGLVYAKLIDPNSGSLVADREVNIPTGGMVQVYADQLEPAETKLSRERPGHYTLQLEANHSFNGYFQHILWDRSSGALTNLTTCEGAQSNVGSIGFVHSSILADNRYPSHIVVTNPTDRDMASVSLTISDASTGSRLASYATQTFLKARGSRIITVAELERGSGLVPDERFPHYVVKADEGFAGTLQHLIVNEQAGGVVTDLTTACPLSGAN